MAFCPNCGTPNTDQAEKCVACSFDLSPKPKGRFKGTIMMQGTQVPTAPQAPAQPTPQAAPAPSTTQPQQPRPSAPSGKNMAFEKTMMGGTGLGLPPTGAFGTPGVPPAGFNAPTTPAPAPDLGRAPTVEGPRPGGFGNASDSRNSPQGFGAGSPPGGFSSGGAFGGDAPAQGAGGFGGASSGGGFGGSSATPTPSGFGNTGGGFGGGSGGGFGNTAGSFQNPSGGFANVGGNTGGGFGNTGGGFGNSVAPVKPNNNKMIVLGCGGAILLTLIAVAVLLTVGSKRPGGLFGDGGRDSAALEWRGSLSTALVQVAALCQADCQSAAVYFHQDVQASLLEQAKLLTPARATKLADPTQSEAQMLDQTDDANIAEKLKLDAAQCVRVSAAAVKVVGCSVPTPGGRANLRIVHMEGVGSL